MKNIMKLYNRRIIILKIKNNKGRTFKKVFKAIFIYKKKSYIISLFILMLFNG